MQYPPSFGVMDGSNGNSAAQIALEMERLRLQSQQLQLEKDRLEQQKRDAEERREREDRREKEEREAAHARHMHTVMAAQQAQAQSNVSMAAMTAHTAMSTATHCGAGGATVVYQDETYCGPISWLIGCFLFPCICCCPIDRRKVPVAVSAPSGPAVVMAPGAMPYAYPPQAAAAAGPAYGAPLPPDTYATVNLNSPAVGKPATAPKY